MRIEIKTEGGLAYFPGLDKPIRLDSADLSKHDVEELETLIAEAQFFDLPRHLNQPARGAADYRTYTLTIEDGSRRHTVQAAEPINNDEFLALLHFIQEKANMSG